MSSVEQISETARAFVSARQQGKGLAAYPGPAPQDLATAYAIQERAIALHGGIVGGWKVGRIWPPMEQVHKTNRLAGPIFAHSIGNGSAPVGHVFADGFAAAEAEYLFRLHDDIPATIASLPLNELGALIAAVHVGIEIASSPYIGINADGPAVTISDFGNNNGLIVGAAIDGWSDSAFADWPVQLAIDEVTVGTGIAADFPDGPFGAVRFLLGNLQDRGIAATPGMWISSGAITGVHPVRPGQHVEARFGDRYHMECTIAAVPTPTGTGE
jgi:2-keto-4-pentenoate hydratase